MGLFDGLSSEDKQLMFGLGLLNFGGGMLQGNQPGAGFMGALGGGLSSGANGMLAVPQMQQQQQLRQLQGMKIQSDIQKAQDEAKQREAWQRMFSNPNAGATSPGQQIAQTGDVALPGVTQVPTPGAPQALPQQSPFGQIPPGMLPFIAQMGPEKGSAFVAQLLGKQIETGQWEDIGGGLQKNRLTGEQKPISPKLVDLAVNPNINMPPIQTEEQKTVGKFYGESYTQLQSDAMKAQANNSRLDTLSTLLDKTYTGAGGESVQDLKRVAKAMGFDIEGVGEGDAGRAVAAQMALELRNPAGGAGMPGAMSDKDREFLTSMVPGLSQTPEGRKTLVETYKKINQRNIEVAKKARDYRKKNGMINEGFFDELQAYSEKNQLFANMPKPQQRIRIDINGNQIP